MDHRIGQSALSQLVEQHSYWGGDDGGDEPSAQGGGGSAVPPPSPVRRSTDDVVWEAINVFLAEVR